MGQLLRSLGYSLQGARKTIEGTEHPDRDAQFRYINDLAGRFLRARLPVISVDTKKKELVGRYHNKGRQWRPKGQPEQVKVHDFIDPAVGKAIPYGVYDVGADQGWVSVGRDHDTAAFAVHAIAPLVVSDGLGRLPTGPSAADLRRRRRLQQLPQPALEARARPLRRRVRADHHRVPLPARHLQVEPDRAPPLRPHLDELAGPTAHQPRGRSSSSSVPPPPAPGSTCTPSTTTAPTPPASRSATPSSPPYGCDATTSTATGTTASTRPATAARYPSPHRRNYSNVISSRPLSMGYPGNSSDHKTLRREHWTGPSRHNMRARLP